MGTTKRTSACPHTSVWTKSNHFDFVVLLAFRNLTFFYFLNMQSSHKFESMDFSLGSFPLDSRTLIPFLLICPSLRCQVIVPTLDDVIDIVPFEPEVT